MQEILENIKEVEVQEKENSIDILDSKTKEVVISSLAKDEFFQKVKFIAKVKDDFFLFYGLDFHSFATFRIIAFYDKKINKVYKEASGRIYQDFYDFGDLLIFKTIENTYDVVINGEFKCGFCLEVYFKDKDKVLLRDCFNQELVYDMKTKRFYKSTKHFALFINEEENTFLSYSPGVETELRRFEDYNVLYLYLGEGEEKKVLETDIFSSDLSFFKRFKGFIQECNGPERTFYVVEGRICYLDDNNFNLEDNPLFPFVEIEKDLSSFQNKINKI